MDKNARIIQLEIALENIKKDRDHQITVSNTFMKMVVELEKKIKELSK